MSVVTVSEVNFGGNGSSGSVLYNNSGTQKLLNQLGAEGVQTVNVEVLVVKDGQLPPQQATALIAIDNHRNQLKDANHLLVLPCPPYCGGD